VQIVHPAEGEFLIGDCPALTVGDGGAVGVVGGVALGDGKQIVMPISPRTLIAVGPEAVGVVDRRIVEELNEIQVRAAVDYVFMRPDSGLEPFARRTRFNTVV